MKKYAILFCLFLSVMGVNAAQESAPDQGEASPETASPTPTHEPVPSWEKFLRLNGLDQSRTWAFSLETMVSAATDIGGSIFVEPELRALVAYKFVAAGVSVGAFIDPITPFYYPYVMGVIKFPFAEIGAGVDYFSQNDEAPEPWFMTRLSSRVLFLKLGPGSLGLDLSFILAFTLPNSDGSAQGLASALTPSPEVPFISTLFTLGIVGFCYPKISLGLIYSITSL